MGRLTIETAAGETRFMPASRVSGSVSWELESEPERIDLRLFWYTAGKGDRDVGIVESIAFPHPGPSGSRSFSFELPEGPYSFSGKLISLIWALELTARPSGATERLEITVSPTGKEILLFWPDESNGTDLPLNE
jgi:hypothetical protein